MVFRKRLHCSCDQIDGRASVVVKINAPRFHDVLNLPQVVLITTNLLSRCHYP